MICLEQYAMISMQRRACLVSMTPQEFLSLVGTPDSKSPEELSETFTHFANQSPLKLEPLWLRIKYWEPPVDAWQVIDHDGRHRCLYKIARTDQKQVTVVVEPFAGEKEDFGYSMMTKGLMCDDFAACGYSKHTINNMEGGDYRTTLDKYIYVKPLSSGPIP